LIWSDAARADMRRIYRCIARESTSIEVADKFVVDIQTKARSLAASGFSGAPRFHIGESLHAFPYKDRCLYFPVDGQKLVVIRVLHGRQDVTSEHFKEL
jgi:toxin ParE1/3/4